jgi:hypothetical protein
MKFKKLFLVFSLFISSNLYAQSDQLRLNDLIQFSEFRDVAKNTIFEYFFVYPGDTNNVIFQLGGLSIYNKNLDDVLKKNTNMIFDNFFYEWIEKNPDAIVRPFFMNVIPSPDFSSIMFMVDCLLISEKDTLNVTAVREGILKFEKETFKNNRSRVKLFEDHTSKAGFDAKQFMTEDEIESLYQTFLIAEEEAKTAKQGIWAEE